MLEVIDSKLFMVIFFNGKERKKIDKFLYKSYLNLIKGCKSEENFEILIKKIEPQVARRYVYNLLAKQAYLSTEIEAKLYFKQVSHEIISQIVSECSRLGYLNDHEVITRFIKKKTRQGWGRARIESALIQKGVVNIRSNLFTQMLSSNQQKEALITWIEKKYPDYQKADSQMKGKIFRALRRRGFSESLIREFLFKSDFCGESQMT